MVVLVRGSVRLVERREAMRHPWIVATRRRSSKRSRREERHARLERRHRVAVLRAGERRVWVVRVVVVTSPVRVPVRTHSRSRCLASWSESWDSIADWHGGTGEKLKKRSASQNLSRPPLSCAARQIGSGCRRIGTERECFFQFHFGRCDTVS